MTKILGVIIITFNFVMSALFFLSSQLVLLASHGQPIYYVGFFNIEYAGDRGIDVMYPNFPWVVLFFSLLVNVSFLIILMRRKETKQTSS